VDDKRARILAAARERFRRFGVRKTAMQEIAQDADLAVGTLYRYFKDKDDLVCACADEFIQLHRDQIAAALAAAVPAEQKLRDYLTARFRAAHEVRTATPFAAELARAVLKVKPDRLRDEGRMMWETIVAILKAGVAAGRLTVADPEGDARVLLFAVGFFFPNALNETPPEVTEADLLSVVDWFIRVWRRAG
jgi:AcrR family transcriptional regulator